MKVAIVSILFLAIAALVVTAEEKSKAALERSGSAARGKYLVDKVAMCVECHTPRDANGALLRTRYLHGAPVPVKSPPYPNLKWALKAPVIAGLPGYTVAEGVRLLTEGITRDGRTPDPPMPSFRFSRSDAEAVVSYLKSLR